MPCESKSLIQYISWILQEMNGILWGPVMLVFLVGTGVFLTIRLKFLTWKNIGFSLKTVFGRKESLEKSSEIEKQEEKGDVSAFQALATSLAATIGTGNITGVATAMVAGGPGALVWMWISALFGLSTTYAESVLAVKYRENNAKGEMCGGPMYTLKNGLGGRIGRALAVAFAIFTVGASLGIGNMVQANSVAQAVQDTIEIPVWKVGAICGCLAFIVLMGGIKSIGKVCQFVIPFMALFYVAGGLCVIGIHFKNIPQGLCDIFSMAFSTKAVGGGLCGTIMGNMFCAMRMGISRGVFSNEAGLGSAPIAAAAAVTDNPSKQGYVNMTGPFLDTIVICTLTGLVIAASGVLGTTETMVDQMTGQVIEQYVNGTDLTKMAFESALGEIGGYVVTIGIVFFAFATILGWEYYGEKALEYLISNRKAVLWYRFFYCIAVFVGCVASMEFVWLFSDNMNALMAIPNLISLWVLHDVVAEECFSFQKEHKN